ncbi:MAG: CCA tRNA nucleotidyltransferase [Planctomycetes bacterium]|nr:CCA tRNA nucleotidyltransferase [Planctomycetota bacterium]
MASTTRHAASVPSDVVALCEDFARAGLCAYLCGGTARDLLLGISPSDFDIAVAAPPERVAAVIGAEARSGYVREADSRSERHGTTRLRHERRVVDVTSFRAEGAYSDARHPDAVRFVDDIALDAARRDFTINAIYVDPLTDQVVDPVDGRSDLVTRRLRVIGDALARLIEDPLRVLRALRFASTHDCVPDASCHAAILGAASRVISVSKPRVRDELERTFVGRGRGRALGLLVSCGVAAVTIEGLAELADVPQPPEYHPEGDVLRHTALVLACLEEPVDPRLAWAAVFHDIGKRDTLEFAADRIRFHGHDQISATRAHAWLSAHGARREFADDVTSIIEEHIRIAAVPGFRAARRARFLLDPLFPLHMAFHRADCLASHGKLDIHRALLELRASLPPEKPAPLLSGKDLVAAGFRPGPAIGILLRALEEARFEGAVNTRTEGLDFVHEFATRNSIPCPRAPKDSLEDRDRPARIDRDQIGGADESSRVRE